MVSRKPKRLFQKGFGCFKNLIEDFAKLFLDKRSHIDDTLDCRTLLFFESFRVVLRIPTGRNKIADRNYTVWLVTERFSHVFIPASFHILQHEKQLDYPRNWIPLKWSSKVYSDLHLLIEWIYYYRHHCATDLRQSGPHRPVDRRTMVSLLKSVTLGRCLLVSTVTIIRDKNLPGIPVNYREGPLNITILKHFIHSTHSQHKIPKNAYSSKNARNSAV